MYDLMNYTDLKTFYLPQPSPTILLLIILSFIKKFLNAKLTKLSDSASIMLVNSTKRNSTNRSSMLQHQHTVRIPYESES